VCHSMLWWWRKSRIRSSHQYSSRGNTPRWKLGTTFCRDCADQEIHFPGVLAMGSPLAMLLLSPKRQHPTKAKSKLAKIIVSKSVGALGRMAPENRILWIVKRL